MEKRRRLEPENVFRVLGNTGLRPFETEDYALFPGVSSQSPFIGEYEKWVVIVDGSRVEFYDTANDDNVRQFVLHAL